MRIPFLAFTCMALVAMGYGSMSSAGGDVNTPNGKPKPPNAPQATVACTGWHALCDASTDCQIDGDKANCNCWRVNEIYAVVTAKIQDAPIKRLTQTKCTNAHPCDVDQAPVCKTIQSGRYTVENDNREKIKYPWVSTYSYRGWCSTFKPKACDINAPHYQGDQAWADCMAAPCTENPTNPDQPLNCQCRKQETSFVGINDSCTGTDGGIISTISLLEWDFTNNTFRIPPPGYEYVQGACAPLTSDPYPPAK